MVRLQKIERRTLADEVYERLSEEIVHGRMEPGVALPPERTLVEMLGVNRGAIREALKRLAQARLVAIQQGGGTTVLDYRKNGSLDLLGRLLFRSDGTVDLDVGRSILEMRAALAPDIARLCARRGGSKCAARLGAVVDDMRAAQGDLDRLQILALRFWDELARGSGNIAYALAFNTLRQTYELIRGALVQIMADEVRDLEAYRGITEATARSDEAEAARVAAALVEHGTRRMMLAIATLRGRESKEGVRDAGGVAR